MRCARYNILTPLMQNPQALPAGFTKEERKMKKKKKK